MRISVNESPYYAGVPTMRLSYPIYTKHGRIFANGASQEAADAIVYALNSSNHQFEEEDMDDLISDMETAKIALESAIEALDAFRSPTGTGMNTLVMTKEAPTS